MFIVYQKNIIMKILINWNDIINLMISKINKELKIILFSLTVFQFNNNFIFY